MPAAESTKQIEDTIEREKGKLFGFIRNNVPTKEDAEDIFQEVLYQFAAGFTEIEYADRISAWLMRVARNKIIDSRRKKREQPFSKAGVRSSGDESGDALSLADIIPDLRSLPDEMYWQNLIWDEIEDALDEMPDEQRKIFVMNEFDGLSFKEIAELKREPVNTLLSRKRYAILFLRKKLDYLYKEISNNVLRI
jgi:RNA polymerase sigma factor (sigma-70 family)